MRAELPSVDFWCCLTQRSLSFHPKITSLGIVSIPKSPTWGGYSIPKTIHSGDCFHPKITYLGNCSKNLSTPGPTSFHEGPDPTLVHPTAHDNEKTLVSKTATQQRGDTKTSRVSLNARILGKVGTYHLGLALGVRLPWAPGGLRGGGCHRRGAGPIPRAGGRVTGVEGQHVTLGDILQ